MCAFVHCEFKVDPDTLDADTLAKYIARLEYYLKKTGRWQTQ